MRIGFAALVATMAMMACGAGAQTKVTVGLGTTPTLIYGVHYLALNKGFFKEEGLDVEYVIFDGTATLMPQVAQKRILTAWPNPDVLILSRQPGRDPLPMKCVYNGVRTTAWEYAVLADSPVKTIADLRGRKIGVISLAMGSVPITKSLLGESGMVAGTDYQIVPVGQGATAFRALNDKQVDALNLFDGQHLALEFTGTRIRRLEQPAKYVNQFSNCWVVHNDSLRERPDVLARFGRAFAKASVACQANWAECVRSFWSSFPAQKPTEGTEEEKLQRGIAILRSRTDKFFTFPAGKPQNFGEYYEEDWRNFVDVLHAGGQITTRNIPVGEMYSNQLVPEFNRFDRAAVARRAAEWK